MPEPSDLEKTRTFGGFQSDDDRTKALLDVQLELEG